jgi:hypothetical protein
MARAREQARGMHTTELTSPRRAPSAPGSGSHAARADRPAAPAPPTFGEIVEEIITLIGAIVVVAPPVVFVAGPWLLLGLMLSGPFALVVALVAATVALVALVASVLAILAAPYLLVRYVLDRRARHAAAAEPAAPLVSVGYPQVAA